ncbi:MAG: SDR family oxidoreductase [Chloroflexota bacterium]
MTKTIIVTGGSSGIGRAIAAMFAQQGACIVIFGRTEQMLRETSQELGDQVSWQQVDVANSDEVVKGVEAILEEHPRIDVLVNNAGFSGGFLTSDPISEAEAIWDGIVSTSLKGSFLMAMAVAPHLTRPGGRIINISSIAAYTGGSRSGAMAYAAAKSGLHGLTYSLARELGPEGITVNAVAPGLVLDTMFFGGRGLPEDRIEQTVSQTPVGRTGKPEDIASAVSYLASDEASFVTGEVLNVNGGWLFGR